jgi:hypothetical protein
MIYAAAFVRGERTAIIIIKHMTNKFALSIIFSSFDVLFLLLQLGDVWGTTDF